MGGLERRMKLWGLLAELGDAAEHPGRAFLSRPGTGPLLGLANLDGPVGLKLLPEQPDFGPAAARIGARVGIEVRFSSPADLIPVPAGWEERSEPIRELGSLSFFHFDIASQALLQASRPDPASFGIAQEMIAAGLLTPDCLQTGFASIEGDLPRFPELDAAGFRHRVDRLCCDEENGVAIALGKSELDLLAELGAYGNDISPREALDKGARAYRALSRSLRDAICESPDVQELVREGRSELELAGAIVDLVSAANHHLPVATVTALTVKSGIANLCAKHWG